jgi:hypothetical protein
MRANMALWEADARDSITTGALVLDVSRKFGQSVWRGRRFMGATVAPDAGATALARMLKGNTKITDLNLEGEGPGLRRCVLDDAIDVSAPVAQQIAFRTLASPHSPLHSKGTTH